jgi:hypothetical protein
VHGIDAVEDGNTQAALQGGLAAAVDHGQPVCGVIGLGIGAAAAEDGADAQIADRLGLDMVDGDEHCLGHLFFEGHARDQVAHAGR